jgi:putative sterol carrier protein
MEDDMTLSVADLFAKMPSAFQAEKASGMDAVIQFKFTGEQAGDWYVTIQDSKCTVATGLHASPKLTLSAVGTDAVKVFSGEMDGMQAFMQGKLRLTGDMSLAMKLMSIFKIK